MLWAVGIAGIVAAVVIGLPQCGANAGGFVTALAAAALLTVRLRGDTPLWRAWPALLAAAAGVMGFAVIDLAAGSHTHFGRMLQRALESGLRPALDTAAGKAMLSYRTLTDPKMIRTLGLGAVGIGLWVAVGRTRLRLLAQASPTLVRVVPVLALTALIALLFNDTGVVAGGLVIGIGFFAILYAAAGTVLDERAAR